MVTEEIISILVERFLQCSSKTLQRKRIQKLRQDRNITQELLADELGVSHNHLGKIEKGTRGTSVNLLIEMSEYFNVPTDYILFGRMDTLKIKSTLHTVITQLSEIEKLVS